MGIIKKLIYHLIDIILAPLTFLIALWNKKLSSNRFMDFPLSKKIFLRVGVYPIRDHYYEPMFNTRHLKHSLRLDRNLPGIDLNMNEQLDLLTKFDYNNELRSIPLHADQKTQKNEFCYNVGPFLSGDAEYLYSMIRHFKPRTFIEVGSGHSTLMAIKALEQNNSQDAKHQCSHICIEPFENKWLEELPIEIKREKVEDIELSYFDQLGEHDILFIDSSHMIRPQGDVLFEYLELLPLLKKGVVVHIHDIFMPRDYPDEWLNSGYFWNEQYLLEAFLTQNRDYRIIGATNYLRHNHFTQFSDKCPILKDQVDDGITREPGSFWMIRN